MSGQTFGTSKYGKPPEDMLKAVMETVSKLRGLPPANWVLLAPDGRTWADPDAKQIARIILAQIDTNCLLTGE